MEMQELDVIEDEKTELSVFIEKQKIFQKDAKKYLVFVVALPLIGAVGLALYGALSYEYGMNTNQKMEILPDSVTIPPITNNQIGRDLDLKFRYSEKATKLKEKKIHFFCHLLSSDCGLFIMSELYKY